MQRHSTCIFAMAASLPAGFSQCIAHSHATMQATLRVIHPNMLAWLQANLAAAGEVGAAKKPFDLHFPQLGPYALDFTRSGNFMVIGGRKGHLALLQWQQAQQFAEVQVCPVYIWSMAGLPV